MRPGSAGARLFAYGIVTASGGWQGPRPGVV